MTEREEVVREAIEELLSTATGRHRRGSVDDVLLRVIGNSEFAAMAKFPSDGLGIEDAKKLANALWCIIVSTDVSDPLMISSTIPGISGTSTRMEFAEAWASHLVHGTRVPDVTAVDRHGSRCSETDLRAGFEEYLVSVVALYSLHIAQNEFFSFRLIVPKMIEFGEALGDPARHCQVCERFLKVMATF